MKRTGLLLALLFAVTAISYAQDPPATTPPAGRQGGRGNAQPPRTPPPEFFSKNTPKDLVEFDMMTWPEVYRAIHEQGKTTALFYVGGTESRGPQNVNGGHTIMARATVKAIALKLGNAIAMPVLAYSPNNASAQATGTIGLTNDLLSAMLEQLSRQAIITGFTDVIIMGDHGGGQPAAYKVVADKLEAEFAPQGKHVYFCDEVYAKAQGDFDTYLKSVSLPVSSHAGIPDTSTMMYLQGKTQDYTRLDLLPVAMTVPAPADPSAPRPVASGVSGDGRKSSVELGQKAFNIKVDYAVRQITAFIASQKK